jgi:type III pantothenate kinase
MAMSDLKLADIDDCIISTVVPQSLFNQRNLARRYLNIEPFVIGENVDLGIAVRLSKPSEVGADRLVNTVGAYHKYGGPLIVIDSGTATTFDIVGKDGAFEGGIIAPGINLSMKALHEAAAKLPRISIQRPPQGQVIGKDTVSAMQSGVFWGYIDLIDGLVERIKAEYGEPMKVVGTGGVVSLFDGSARTIDYYDSDVTISGLLQVYERNKAKAGAART